MCPPLKDRGVGGAEQEKGATKRRKKKDRNQSGENEDEGVDTEGSEAYSPSLYRPPALQSSLFSTFLAAAVAASPDHPSNSAQIFFGATGDEPGGPLTGARMSPDVPTTLDGKSTKVDMSHTTSNIISSGWGASLSSSVSANNSNRPMKKRKFHADFSSLSSSVTNDRGHDGQAGEK